MGYNDQSETTEGPVNRMINEGLGAGLTAKKSGREEAEIKQVVPEAQEKDALYEGKDHYWLDVDRMINEGPGGGQMGARTGEIEENRPLKEEAPTPETDEE